MKKLLLFLFIFASVSAIAQVNTGLKVTVNGKRIVATASAYGKELDYDKALCSEIVPVESAGATPAIIAEGCTVVLNTTAVAGKIALVKRGICNLNVKVKNAQDAGAIAVLIYNNTAAAPTALTGASPDITVACGMIGQADGEAIVADLKAGKKVTVCLTNPAVAVSTTYGNALTPTVPLSQMDTVLNLLAVVNKTPDTIRKAQIFAEITAPSGAKKLLNNTAEDFPPTGAGFVNLLDIQQYVPTEKGTYNVRYYSTFSADTTTAQFVVSDYTFANDIGTLSGLGTSRAAATFAATDLKKSSHLNYFITGEKGAKATYATFGIINAAAMKGRKFEVSLWETTDEKLANIAGTVTSVGDVAETFLGDGYIYTMGGTEKSSITVPLTDGSKKYIELAPNTKYILAVEYDGTSYTDSISPQYTLARTVPTRWPGFSVFGTAFMTGAAYFSGGWSGPEDPLGRLHVDAFVGAEDLQQLEASEVSVFPNPARDVVQLKLDLKEQHKKVELGVMDVMGNIIHVYPVDIQQGTFPVNISSYPTGTYFFTVKTDKGFATEKVIKE